MTHILPTHTCFDDALDMLQEAIKANPGSAKSGELKLVHAICLMPDGQEYAHAWVESNGKHCWFMGMMGNRRHQFVATIEDYYAELRVKETTKYTPEDAWHENDTHVTYGPWNKEYLALCKDRQHVLRVA